MKIITCDCIKVAFCEERGLATQGRSSKGERRNVCVRILLREEGVDLLGRRSLVRIGAILETHGKNKTDEMGSVCLPRQGVACVCHLSLARLP